MQFLWYTISFIWNNSVSSNYNSHGTSMTIWAAFKINASWMNYSLHLSGGSSLISPFSTNNNVTIRTLTTTGHGKQDTCLHVDNTRSKYYALLSHSDQIKTFWMKELQIMWHFWLYVSYGHTYWEGQDRTCATTTTNTCSCNICDTNYHKANIRNEVLFDLKLEILKAVV